MTLSAGQAMGAGPGAGPSRAVTRWSSPLAAVGDKALRAARLAGGLFLLLLSALSRLVRRDFDRSELLRHLYEMTVRSLPLVSVTAVFMGGMLTVQGAPIIKRLGAESQMGYGAGFSALREMAPLFTGLMISGRVGANNAAELATMVITEQTYALRALAIDPISYLVAPRLVAIVTTMVVMTIYADLIVLLSSEFLAVILLRVTPATLENSLSSGLLGWADVGNGLIKATCYGVMIALSSCYFGLRTEGGARGVGRSVNATVVVSAGSIFLFDYLVSFALG